MLKRRIPLNLSDVQIQKLKAVQSSPLESRTSVVRARILLRYHGGERVGTIARQEGVSRPTVYLCIQKAVALGVEGAIRDLSRSGRPARNSREDRSRVKEWAGSKPLSRGGDSEKGIMRVLGRRVKTHASETGHHALEQVCANTLRRVLGESAPKNLAREPNFREKELGELQRSPIQVLALRRGIQILLNRGEGKDREQAGSLPRRHSRGTAQTPGSVIADLSVQPSRHNAPCPVGDFRHVGTVFLMAAIDLSDGHVLARVRDGNTSEDFLEFLKAIHEHYPLNFRIQLTLSRHSVPISRYTMKWLQEHPFRFEFVFTPQNGALIRVVETLFTRMIGLRLRSFRARSTGEIIRGLYEYLETLNLVPAVPSTWEPCTEHFPGPT